MVLHPTFIVGQKWAGMTRVISTHTQRIDAENRRKEVEAVMERGDYIGDVVHSFDITEPLKKTIQEKGQYLFQEQKGAVSFDSMGKAIIHALQGADISTLMHEIGHIFRRTLSKSDMEIAEKWAGVEEHNWDVDAEEKFARGFERYLAEGKTTNEHLKGIFEKFKDWMSEIYTRIKGSPIDVELSQDMRNLFDRILAEPTEESVKTGRQILRAVAGIQGPQYLEEVEPADEDIPSWYQFAMSPEFALRNHPEAQRDAGRIIGATFKAGAKSDEYYSAIKEAKRLAGKKDEIRVRKGIETLYKGSEDEIKALQQEKPNVYEAAKVMKEFFEGAREDIKRYKSEMFIRSLPASLGNAFEAVASGETTVKAAVSKYGVEEKALQDLVNEWDEIENWGIDEYITNMERGTYRFIGEDGHTVLVAVTKKQAIEKAVKYLKENPHIHTLTLETGMGNTKDIASDMTRTQYFAFMGKIHKVINEKLKGINKALSAEEIRHEVGRLIRVKPSYKYAGPLVKREDVLKGEENIFDVAFSYAYLVANKTSLDPVIHSIRTNSPTYPKKVRDLLLNLMDYAKGRYSFGDKVVDEWTKQFGAKPLLFSRAIGQARKIEGNLKLGYRPIAGLINFVSGQGHTWVKTGIKYMAKASKFLRSEEGKRFIAVEEPYLGVTFSVDEALKIHTKEKWWKPLKIFALPEPINRKVSIVANYLYAKEELGMDEAEAREEARRAVRFQQFTYNVASLPRMLRSPVGKLAGQFKTYLVKEIEFISQLKGKEWLRYIGLQMALAGPRGILYIAKSLPVLGALGMLDDLEEWMNQEHPGVPLVGDKIPTLSRGIAGLLGGDITMPAIVQLPNRPTDWAGPFLSDMIRFYTTIMQPILVGEGEDVPGYDLSNTIEWAKSLAPAMYYWNHFFQTTNVPGITPILDKTGITIYDEDGWVRDPSGNKMYRIDSNWQRGMLAMALPPMQKTQVDVARRLLKREEEIRNKNVKHVVVDLLNHIDQGKDIPDDLIKQIVVLGITNATILNAAERRELPPKLRALVQSREAIRPKIVKTFPD